MGNRTSISQLQQLLLQIFSHQGPPIEFAPREQTADYPPAITLLDEYFRGLHERGLLHLPYLGHPNETVAMFSDYAGDDSSSTHFAYSYLLMAYNYRDLLDEKLAQLREKHGMMAPPREIALKNLRYGPMGRMLPEFLDTLDDNIAGLLVTIVVDKRISTLMGVDGDDAPAVLSRTLDDAGIGGWKSNVVERVLRITHFASYLAAHIVPPGIKLFWMTDEDAIVPNDAQGRGPPIWCQVL